MQNIPVYAVSIREAANTLQLRPAPGLVTVFWPVKSLMDERSVRNRAGVLSFSFNSLY